ncbi:SDR family NAD(P)-dependent oxidoreductase [Chenggangzhangella methanolivorans]|uniref:SDR family oxidoreductase n=1 Tax=Chenggangzhangella methanolivorans TaxID=1437009 RepID=A0A9E6UNB6_9HYPH|nr:SDR family oxidoreductase [Chenggangzhangella methanolivorans]QZO00886.1 SDR family oxidoreductase [Chenggangzhangella methanolivorans]
MSLFENNRTVLITGASSGIGVELARLFAANGDKIILTARRADRLKALAKEFWDKHAIEAAVAPADLAKPDGAKELAIAIGRKGLVVDVLVNNAGFGLRGDFAKLPLDRQLAMVQVNVTAPTALAGLFLPGMLARGKGGILNVASLAAFQAGPEMAVYYASKAYLLSLSEALHEEAKSKNVTVTALCPGPVPTEFGEVAKMGDAALFKTGVVSAEDVAKAGFEGFQAGEAIVIPGALPKLGAFGTRFIPRGVSRRLAHELQRVKE